MKQLYYLRIATGNLCLLGITVLAVILIACSDMSELYQPYLDRGEVIYAAKVDSVVAHPGRNRIQFDLFVESQRIKTVRIFWNDYKELSSGLIKYRDSSDVAIEGKGIFKKMLDNMDEKIYVFKLVSFDEFGNESLPTELSAYVYGSKYQAQLISRSLRSTVIRMNGDVKISWGIADGAYASEVRYTDVSGNIKTQSFPIDETTSIITDLKINTGYEFRTVYKPDTTGIDSFFTDYETAEPPFGFDKTEWKVIDYSSQHSGDDNKATNVIDGTDKTRWHACASGTCSSIYPHYVTIDMGVVRTITRFGASISLKDAPLTGDNRAPDVIEFFVSTDNVNYTTLGGERNFNSLLIGEQIYDTPETQARYFKFVAVSGGPETYTVMGELNAYGF